MNDDLVVQKILKLLENNTAFIGYALNGGIGTKINVRNTETGKTIQALSINVDSTGEVLVVKDSEDNQYKAVTFKTAEKVSERIIQLRKTKPVDDKKTIEYTDSDIEVFYLFVKLIDTGSPVPTQLTSTWIRKGSSCTQFVGAYERCNYASKETIGGVSYTGLPYIEYETLQACLDDDLGRDAKTPHGSKDENGVGLGWRIYSTKVTQAGEQAMLAALTSHDAYYNTNYKKLFGYGSIIECSGAMNLAGWESGFDTNGVFFTRCEFSFFPGFTNECSSAMQTAGYCDTRGFISSRAPLFGQEEPGQPSVGAVDNSWGHEYGWKDLPYEFMYKRHFSQSYLNGSTAPGSFVIFEGLTEDQQPTIPEGYFLWVPGCPTAGSGGPYDGSGGNRFPDAPPLPQKRDMKLSTHKAEIWLGSSKKTEAIKLYELGASDLFSGMYNAFIIPANESDVDIKNRLNSSLPVDQEGQALHEKFYQNRNKNIIDLRIDPRVWVYIIDNIPKANYARPSIDAARRNPNNSTLQLIVDNLYNRTINLTVVDKKTQVVHLKLGLKPKNSLGNTDCKGTISAFGDAEPATDMLVGQSWEYQKYVTIKIKDWTIESTSNTLDTTLISSNTWNKNYIERKFFTFFEVPTLSFGNSIATRSSKKDSPNSILLRPDSNISLSGLTSGNNYEQYNYSQALAVRTNSGVEPMNYFVSSSSALFKPVTSNDGVRAALRSTSNWWSLWNRTVLNQTTKRLNSVVGYDLNYFQILTNYGLSPSLDYFDNPLNNSQIINNTSYWDYLESRPKITIPSNIRSVRNKLISSLTELSTRDLILNTYGLNFYHSYYFSGWSFYTTAFRLDNIEVPIIESPSAFYNSSQSPVTLEEDLFNLAFSGRFFNAVRLNTSRWFNRLWSQFLYEGVINVDVESYKDVEFTSPTNPEQYIKFTISEIYSNNEYNFVLDREQELETVLSPGTLDITKQVKMTKPTNVDLDPNMSFLVYLLPNVEVTKKKKTI